MLGVVVTKIAVEEEFLLCLALETMRGKSTPERITSLDEHIISAIVSGWDHCLAVDNIGTVYSWGSGQNGLYLCHVLI
jgi:alpha-tubulin suppressor-like RCC1 family protein